MTASTTTTTTVTQEQLDRCHRIVNENTGEVFYQVESERDPLVEYEVHFIKGRGFTCTCPSGQEGFRTCAHGTCKHCRWAHAHADEYRKERAEQALIESYVRQGLDRETATRVVYARETPVSEQIVKIAEYDNQREPFSILR